jgi:hypothetical protein
VAHIDAETEVRLDGLIELGALEALEQAKALERRVEVAGFDSLTGGGISAAVCGHVTYLLW